MKIFFQLDFSYARSHGLEVKAGSLNQKAKGSIPADADTGWNASKPTYVLHIE